MCLTGCAGDGTLVRYSSIEPSSFSNPAEHVGLHSGGAVGCFAELGSEGIAAGSTTGGNGCEFVLQALQSITSS